MSEYRIIVCFLVLCAVNCCINCYVLWRLTKSLNHVYNRIDFVALEVLGKESLPEQLHNEFNEHMTRYNKDYNVLVFKIDAIEFELEKLRSYIQNGN